MVDDPAEFSEEYQVVDLVHILGFLQVLVLGLVVVVIVALIFLAVVVLKLLDVAVAVLVFRRLLQSQRFLLAC